MPRRHVLKRDSTFIYSEKLVEFANPWSKILALGKLQVWAVALSGVATRVHDGVPPPTDLCSRQMNTEEYDDAGDGDAA